MRKENKCTLPPPRLLAALRRVKPNKYPACFNGPERQTEKIIHTEETPLSMPLDEEVIIAEKRRLRFYAAIWGANFFTVTALKFSTA